MNVLLVTEILSFIWYSSVFSTDLTACVFYFVFIGRTRGYRPCGLSLSLRREGRFFYLLYIPQKSRIILLSSHGSSLNWLWAVSITTISAFSYASL